MYSNLSALDDETLLNVLESNYRVSHGYKHAGKGEFIKLTPPEKRELSKLLETALRSIPAPDPRERR